MNVSKALSMDEKAYLKLSVYEREEAANELESELFRSGNRELRHWSAHERASFELNRLHTEQRLRQLTISRYETLKRQHSVVAQRISVMEGKLFHRPKIFQNP